MPDGLKAGEPKERNAVESLTDDQILELIGSVMYYIGIYPYDFKPDIEMPQHEMIGGVRMALRRLFSDTIP